MKEAKIEKDSVEAASGSLKEIFAAYQAQKKPAAPPAPAKAADSSSSSSSSDSDSDSDDDTDTATKKSVAEVKKAPEAKVSSPVKANAASSSSSSSSSDSDSSDDEDSKPAAKPVATLKTAPAKKADSSSDSSSSDSDSDSDDESAAPAAPVSKPAAAPKAAPAKADSSSDSSSSDSDSDDEDVDMGKKEEPKAAPAPKATAAASSSSSSSDSDSDSDGEMIVHDNKRKREESTSNVSTPAKLVKTEAGAVPAADPCCVRVNGMPYETTEDSLKEFFKDCGAIKAVDMPLWEDSGRSKGFANITFESEKAAQACVAMNGATMGTRWLKIELFVPRPKTTYDNTPSAKPEGCTCVFVGNLSYDIDEDTISAAFKDCGEITNVRWGMDRETGDFKGFGHVEFATTEATDKAVAMAGEMVLGRAIRVDYAKGRSASPKRKDSRGYKPTNPKPDGCNTIFVGNLSFNITEDEVWEKFGTCGEVVRVKLATDRETGEYRGFGHVEFASTEAVDEAVNKVAGTKISGREVRIDYAVPRQ